MKSNHPATVKNYSKAKMASVKKHEAGEKKSGHEKMEKAMTKVMAKDMKRVKKTKY